MSLKLTQLAFKEPKQRQAILKNMFFFPSVVILTVTTGNGSRHQSKRGKWPSSPQLSNTPDVPGEHTHAHVQTHHLAVLFPFFCINHDITDVVMAAWRPQTPHHFSRKRDVWTFPTVQGGGVGEADPQAECKYLSYLLNKRDWTEPEEYLHSCPGDHLPGSAHQGKHEINWKLRGNYSWAKLCVSVAGLQMT